MRQDVLMERSTCNKQHRCYLFLKKDNIYAMPKSPQALSTMPPAILSALRSLGENLAIARKRRKESIQTWATRVGVSVPTIRRMEQGDPSVGMGIYATALWMIGQAQKIPALAAPESDLGALEQEVRNARQRSARRSPGVLPAAEPRRGKVRSETRQ